MIIGENTNNTGRSTLVLNGDDGDYQNQDYANLTHYGATGNLEIKANVNGGDGTGNILIIPQGNVGIGTSNPSVRLHIADTASDNVALRFQDDDKNWFMSSSTNEGFCFYEDSTGTTPPLFMEVGGNVGIGITNPTQKLTVAGNINVTTGNDICIDGSGCLSAAVSGSGETNTAANSGAGSQIFKDKTTTQLNFRSLTSSDSSLTLTQNTDDINFAVNSVGVDLIANGAGLYLDYRPNNVACTEDQVLQYDATNFRWECGAKTVDTTLTLDTTNTLGTSDTMVPSQNAVKTYVDTATGAITSSQWTTTGSDIYYNTGNVGIGTTSPGTSRARIVSNGFTNNKVLEVTGGGVSGGQVGPFYGAFIDAPANNNATSRYGVYAEGGGGGGGPNYGVYGTTTMGSSSRLAVGVQGHVVVNSAATNNHPSLSSPVAGVLATATSSGTNMTAVSTALLARNEMVFGSTSFGAYIDALAGPTTVIPLSINYNGSEVMRVTSGGLLGVGTTNPSAQIEAKLPGDGGDILNLASSDAVLFNFNSSRSDNHRVPLFKMIGANNISGTRGVGGIIHAETLNTASQVSDAVMQFNVTESGGAVSAANLFNWSNNDTQLMTMNNSGNLGIGTTAPTQKLTVAGNINVTTGNDICIDGSGCLSAAVSGSGETNTAANTGAGSQVFKDKTTTQLNFRSLASSDSSLTLTQNTDDINLVVNSVGVDLIANGAGLYFGYQPNNVACADTEVLEWDNTNSRWVCGAKTTDTNTNAGTLCSAGEYLDGDGTCKTAATDTGDILDGGNTTGAPIAIGTNDNQAINIETNNLTRLSIDNVKLQSETAGSYRLTHAGITAASPSYSFSNDLDTGIYSSGSNTLEFSTNALERMRVTAAGRVGVTTGSPEAQLDLGSDVSILTGNPEDQQRFIFWNQGDSHMGLGVDMTGASYETNLYGIAHDGSAGQIDFGFLSNDGLWTYSSAMTVKENGNVGIGVAPAATHRLHIEGSNPYLLKLSRETAANQPSLLLFANGDGERWHLGSQGDGSFQITETGVATQLNIEPGGNVGIGTTSPDQKLSVNGNASKTGGTAWAVFSDARLKTVTRKFERGLASVRELDPVFFHYNEDNPLGIKDTEEQVGFVAQEVEKVVPEAVTMMDSGYLQLQSDAIFWTMLNSIKELDLLFGDQVNENVAMFERFRGLEVKVEENSREIASLKEENTALKEKVQNLEERLKLIEEAILKK